MLVDLFLQYPIRRKIAFLRRSEEDLPVDLVVEIIIEEFLLPCTSEEPVLPEEVPSEPVGLMDLEDEDDIGQ